jgi:DNA mismatch repair ATPase MutS
MLKNAELRERVTILLKRSHDSYRLLQKFAFGRGDEDNLLDLAKTISATQDLIATLQEEDSDTPCITKLISRISLSGPSALAKQIKDAIDEEGVVQQHRLADSEAGEMQALAMSVLSEQGAAEEDTRLLPASARKKKGQNIRDHYGKEHYSDAPDTWIMRPGASSVLKRLHSELNTLLGEKKALGTHLCKTLGAETLTLRFTPGLGHICHLRGKDTKLDLSSIAMRPLSSSKSTRSFHHPDWSALGQKLDQTTLRIRAEESRVFNNLREKVIHNIIKLRRNASVLDEIDVACSFASLAAEKSWVRPILNTGTRHKIVGGRHPTVEGGLEAEGRSFVTNDCFVGDTYRSWLITGPNMAGKSTFLRQNALITILAQVGSYVPASYAELGIVDQIFSRVGSADNLYRDQSTFMVEMLETAQILKNATARSFVIMDEIGRGTTPEDGVAVAFACLHHLYYKAGCRVLFATHFHKLADLVKVEGMDGVGYFCTDVQQDEVGEGWRYVHKLREGVNRQSHALKVAGLAGLPEDAIAVARQVLDGSLGAQ